MTKTIIITMAILGAWVGAQISIQDETPKAPEITQIRPLHDHLIQLPPNWKKAYGDTLETRFVYNIAVLRNNQMEIAKMISRLHPVDPNVPIDPNE